MYGVSRIINTEKSLLFYVAREYTVLERMMCRLRNEHQGNSFSSILVGENTQLYKCRSQLVDVGGPLFWIDTINHRADLEIIASSANFTDYAPKHLITASNISAFQYLYSSLISFTNQRYT